MSVFVLCTCWEPPPMRIRQEPPPKTTDNLSTSSEGMGSCLRSSWSWGGGVRGSPWNPREGGWCEGAQSLPHPPGCLKPTFSARVPLRSPKGTSPGKFLQKKSS